MTFPEELKYTRTHEWIRFEDETTAFIGITDYAQDQLGDLVFVNLPEEGDEVTVDEAFGDVESVKTVSDVISPVSGTVAAVNEEIQDSPQLMNEQPYEAWFIKVADISATGELLSAAEYEALIAEEG